MYKIARQFLFILIVLTSINVKAQETYTISGKVVNENAEPIQGATVFISGTKIITVTDVDGQFSFKGIVAGNYTVSTSMLGYSTPSQPLTVTNESLNMIIPMNIKPFMLEEVTIGSQGMRNVQYRIFVKQFLGTSKNAKQCVILNPEVLNFSRKKVSEFHMSLEADADDFLIIENKRLGYRVKYLLSTFTYNPKTTITFYEGDAYFEELAGSDKQLKAWTQNRLDAYQGSLMHYLRSIFAGKTVEEGFITNQLVRSDNAMDLQYYIHPDSVNFSALVSPIDSSFVSFRFGVLNIYNDPKKAAPSKKQENIKEDEMSALVLTSKNSQLLLREDRAIIDNRGSTVAGNRTFLIRGNWAGKRIGDQLPFEYMPPETSD